MRVFSSAVTTVALIGLLSPMASAHAAGSMTSRPTPAVITSDTTLKLGQKGVIKVRNLDNKKVPVAIRVTKLQKGKPADLRGQGLRPSDTKGMVPFYIRVVLNYAGADYHGDPGNFYGVSSDGSRSLLLGSSKGIGPCTEDSIVTISKSQRRASACVVVLVARGAKLVAAEFNENNEAGQLFTVAWRK